MTPEANPIIARLERNGVTENIHRGAWALVELAEDGSSSVIDSVGNPHQQIFARSAMKGLQALPLLESGAADAFDLQPDEIALVCASHSAEPQHVAMVQKMLDRVSLTEDDLGCGPSCAWHSRPLGPKRQVNHCCSGKHAGMLILTVDRGADPARYLDPSQPAQELIKTAVAELTGTDLFAAVDGCNAPTFGMPLSALATGIARLCTPASLPEHRRRAAQRITDSAAAHPQMIGGSFGRSDTELIAATDGRIFAKLGAEGVFVAGEIASGKALAINVDDGNERAFHALCLDILHRHEMLTLAEVASLGKWADRTIRNAAGTPTGQLVI